MATLEELVIKVSADTKGLQTQLTQVQNQLKKTESAGAGLVSTFKKYGADLLAGFAIYKIGDDFKEIVNHMDDVSKASARLGVSTESLSKLGYAAKLADIDFASLEQSVRFMERSLAQAVGDSKSSSNDAFKRLGVSAKELIALQPDEALLKIADGFQKIENPSLKSATAIDIFGRAGARMLNLFQNGSQGLRELFAEAEKFGVVIKGSAGSAAEDFNDSLTRLHAAYEGLIYALAQDGTLKTLAETFAYLAQTIAAAVNSIKDLRSNIGFVANASSIMKLKQDVNSTQSDYQRAQENFANPQSHQGVKWGVRSEEGVRSQSIRELQQSMSELNDEQERYKQLTGDLIAGGVKPEAVGMGGNSNTSPVASKTYSSSGVVDKQQTAARNKELDDLKSKLKSITESTKTDVEKAQDDIATLDKGFMDHLITDAGEYNKMRSKLNENLEEAVRHADTLENRIKDIADNAVTSIGDQLVEAMQRGESAGKALWTSIKVNAVKAITDIALEWAKSNIMGGIGGASSKSGGLGSLLVSGASKLWAALPSFDSGGFTGPGGGSGVDGKGGFPALLHPNEAVLNQAQMKGMSGGGSSYTQNVNIIATNTSDIDRRIQMQIPNILALSKDLVRSEMSRGGQMTKEVNRRL